MPRYLTREEMNILLLDFLYGKITMTEIAERQRCSVGNIHHKLRALVHSLGFHHSTRDPHIISAAYYRRDVRNLPFKNTPAAFYRNERGLTEYDYYG